MNKLQQALSYIEYSNILSKQNKFDEALIYINTAIQMLSNEIDIHENKHIEMKEPSMYYLGYASKTIN